MNSLQLFFIGLPLMLIVIAAMMTAVRQRGEPELSYLDSFISWVAMYSMIGTVVGMVGFMVVAFSFGGIPGMASNGGIINGQYYFSLHGTDTAVSKLTWVCAYILEQLATRSMWVSFGLLMVSYGYCYFRSRVVK